MLLYVLSKRCSNALPPPHLSGYVRIEKLPEGYYVTWYDKKQHGVHGKTIFTALLKALVISVKECG